MARGHLKVREVMREPARGAQHNQTAEVQGLGAVGELGLEAGQARTTGAEPLMPIPQCATSWLQRYGKGGTE